MERVLGSEILSHRPRQRSHFSRGLCVAGAAFGTAVTSIEVRMLDSFDD